MITYYLTKVKIRDGEREYESFMTHQIKTNKPLTDAQLNELGEANAKDFYGNFTEQDDDRYFFDGGTVYTTAGVTQRMTKEEYEVVRKFLMV